MNIEFTGGNEKKDLIVHGRSPRETLEVGKKEESKGYRYFRCTLDSKKNTQKEIIHSIHSIYFLSM